MLAVAESNLLQAVLCHWGLQDAEPERFGTGLINQTYLVSNVKGQHFILQGLNKVFRPEVNIDIDALTRHLDERGYVTQRLLPTSDGDLWINEGDCAWRLATFVPGVCVDMIAEEFQAREAGRLLGRFHVGIHDLEMNLHNERLGVHDTQRHLAILKETLATHRDHRYFSKIEPIAMEILSEAESLPELTALPDRLVHGDPKISNLIFDAQSGAGVCMIDLDTLTHMPLPLELGDAFRSWCNPRGEDTQQSEFRLDFFEASVGGYAETAAHIVAAEEWRAFLPATRTIMVELAARFITDALLESYFGWNEQAFPDRSTHNQIRAAGQLDLEKSLRSQYSIAEEIVEAAFSS